MDGRPSPDFFERVFASLPRLYIVLDGELTILAATDSYLEATMTRRDEIVGRRFFDVFPDDPGDLGAMWFANLQASFDRVRRDLIADTMAVQKHDVRIPESQGGGFEVRYWSPANTPLLDEEGRLVAIVHRVEDVTDFVRLAERVEERSQAAEELTTKTLEMEAEILHRAEQLQIANQRLNAAVEQGVRAQRFLESIVENIPSTVFVKDAQDLRFVRVNRSFEELMGLDRAEIVGKTSHDVFAPEEAEFFTKFDRQVLDSRSPVDVPDQLMETRILGSRLLHSRKVPIFDEAGIPRFILGISDDITESHDAAAMLQDANTAMTESLAALERRNQEVLRLNELSELLQACTDGAEACTVAAQSMPALFPASSGAVTIMKPSRNLLEVAAAWGDWAASDSTFAPDDCWALRRGRLHESGGSGPLCKHLLRSNRDAHALCVPMIAQGETIGVFHVIEEGSSAAGRTESTHRARTQLASMAGEQVGMAIANLDLRERLRHLSIRDPLTNLFNRRYMEETFEREIARARRDGESIGVIQLDVDHFKGFNDTHGHEAGDVVLKAVADLLLASVRGGDVVCRYGGEELTLILPNAALESTHERAEELRARLRDLVIPYRGSVLPTPTLSMGVAAYPQHGSAAGDLLRAADRALYRAKGYGRDRTVRANAEEGERG